jgi:LmbE family N-acetylglucosaminyl deacetylase
LSLIGIKNAIFLRQEDGKFKNNKCLLNKIHEIVIELHPDVIYLPHKNEAHPDHKKTYRLVKKSTSNLSHEITLMAYEVWSPLNDFNVVKDITDVIDQKIVAIREHRSELECLRYDKAVKALNRFRGVMYCAPLLVF